MKNVKPRYEAIMSKITKDYDLLKRIEKGKTPGEEFLQEYLKVILKVGGFNTS